MTEEMMILRLGIHIKSIIDESTLTQPEFGLSHASPFLFGNSCHEMFAFLCSPVLSKCFSILSSKLVKPTAQDRVCQGLHVVQDACTPDSWACQRAL